MLLRQPLLRLPRPRTRGLASSTAELLHSSRIPTLHFQDSLPKLPVPTLNATLKRLLSSAEPLVSAAELAETHRLAADFEYGGAGERLQAQLIANDQLRYSSYISQPWFDMYLTDRAPLLLNYNPALCFHDDPGAAGSQVGRAARLVHASMTFLRTLESGNLVPDIFHTEPKKSKTGAFEELVRLLPRSVSFYGAAAVGAYPLDMSQYANLFRSTRLPGTERDALQTYAGSRHVIVQRGGSFFEVEVLDADGGTLPLAHIRWQLQQIVDAPDEAKPDEAVGLLTSLPRHEWAEARAQLGAVSHTHPVRVRLAHPHPNTNPNPNPNPNQVPCRRPTAPRSTRSTRPSSASASPTARPPRCTTSSATLCMAAARTGGSTRASSSSSRRTPRRRSASRISPETWPCPHPYSYPYPCP